MAKAWEWQFSLPLDKVSWRLRSKAKDAGSPLAIGPNLTDIRVVERGPSGRAQTVEVVSTDGIDRVAANSFRLWVGSHQIRSTLWTSAAVRQGTLVIQGRGFGHGVGLSQVSAWAMAKDSRLAPEILRFFYPGARLLRRW
jgi:stage II sporulation protein D